jgi:dUTP pyrophosphatase
MINLKIKKLAEDAVIPTYSRDGDAGLDLVARSMEVSRNFIEYGTGLAVEIPAGHVGLVFPRSSISNKVDTHLANSVGVIDANYRGELIVRFRSAIIPYMVGDRMAQLVVVPLPMVNIEEVVELGGSVRGAGAFGSSGS